MNKKGIELPVSMIVLLILSILMLSFGIVMIFKFFKGATSAGEEIDRATQAEIEAALREKQQLVVLPRNTLQGTLGQKLTFPIGIRNVFDAGIFSIVLSFQGAYKADDTLFLEQDLDRAFIEQNWLGKLKEHTNINIAKDTYTPLLLPVKIGSETKEGQKTQKGTYVFNVCVFKGQPQICTSHPAVLEQIYGKQIYQINIIV